MQQNSQLTNERLAHIYRNLKRWADHDNALNSYISGQKIDPIFHDCVVALSELMDRRKYEKPEPVSFDSLNAAIAEVTGGNQHAWNASIYKGHQEVPFINYNSLSRIVEKFRTTSFGLMDMQECGKADVAEPIAWTDAEELRDLEQDGYAAMLSIKNKDKNTDQRRQIFLYTAPQLAPELVDVLDSIVDEILAVDTIAHTAAIKTLFHMKTGKMRLDYACMEQCKSQGDI